MGLWRGYGRKGANGVKTEPVEKKFDEKWGILDRNFWLEKGYFLKIFGNCWSENDEGADKRINKKNSEKGEVFWQMGCEKNTDIFVHFFGFPKQEWKNIFEKRVRKK